MIQGVYQATNLKTKLMGKKRHDEHNTTILNKVPCRTTLEPEARVKISNSNPVFIFQKNLILSS